MAITKHILNAHLSFILIFSNVAIGSSADSNAIFSDVELIGSALNQRSVVGSHKAVDIISSERLLSTGKSTLPEALSELVPSFNYNRSTIGLEQDLIKPSMLRGMGTDQMLLLINGKAHHNQSLIATSPTTFNPGFSGYDLSAIPLKAINYVEVIRDGASVEYGSGAIAGAINVILKDNDSSSVRTSYSISEQGDGELASVSANIQLVNHEDLNLQLFVEIIDENGFNRSRKLDFEDNLDELVQISHTGQTPYLSRKLWFNHESIVNGIDSFYSFGGYSEIEGTPFAGFRGVSHSQNWQELYPNGYQPQLNLTVQDAHITAGYKFSITDWESDLSVRWSENKTLRHASNTLNASFGPTSPTSGDIGNVATQQLAFNASTSSNIDTQLFKYSTGLVLGTAVKRDEFKQSAGDEVSYLREFHCKEQITFGGVPGVGIGLCSTLQPGFQGFPGFDTENIADKNTESAEFYTLIKQPVSENLELGIGARYTNQLHFDESIVYDVSALYNANSNLSIRGAYSTGYRMPSIQQQYFSETNSYSSDNYGNLKREAVISSDSELHHKLAGDLRPEKSRQLSAGIINTGKNWSTSIDIFYNRIEDRIALSNSIRVYPEDLNVSSEQTDNVRLFTNAVESETYGLDWVSNWQSSLTDFGMLNIDFSYHYHKSKVLEINRINDEIDVNDIFSKAQVIELEEGQPNQKAIIDMSLLFADSQLTLQSSFFGSYKVMHPNGKVYDWNSKVITNAAYAFKIYNDIELTLGISNIFNNNKDKLDPDDPYSSNSGYQYGLQTPMSLAGRGYFLTLETSY